MSRLVEFPDPALLREQAAEWVVRRQRGLSAREQQEFQRWCASPAHLRMLRQMSALFGEMDQMGALADGLPDIAQRRRGTLRRWRPAIAAGLVTGVLVTGVSLYRQNGSTAPAAVAAAQSFETTVGEHRTLPLSDGSVLAINTDSLVEVQPFAAATRELRLVRGEAHFTVAHDASKPFRVQAGSQMIQAVGTAFDVRLHPAGDIEVVVTDGRVKLIPGNAAGEHLDRGQVLRIGVDGSARLTRLDNDALGSRVAWRSGMVVFDGQTLATALEEFSRYTAMRFVIEDPRLRQMRVGGYFPAGDTGYLLEALQASFGLSATRNADGTIRIARGH
jgi:transmembrane sensor